MIITAIGAVLLSATFVSTQHSPAGEHAAAADALVQQLRTGDDETKRRAIAAILDMAPTARTTGLDDELRAELGRLDLKRDRRRQQIKQGVALEPVPDHGLYLRQVLEAVSSSSDPAAIPVLTRFIENGSLSTGALARFGEPAVGQVLPIAEQTKDVRRTSAALYTFTQMLTPPNGTDLSASSRQRIRDVAARHLASSASVIVLRSAATLAKALNDTVLLARVAELASHPEELRKMGVSEQGDIDWVQNALQNVLLPQEAR